MDEQKCNGLTVHTRCYIPRYTMRKGCAKPQKKKRCKFLPKTNGGFQVGSTPT
nr:MAG TPA: hypothetical protein [Caudoviricetes sp.]